MGRELDVLVAPLGGPVDAGDQAGPVDTPKVAVDEAVPGLRLIRRAVGQAQMPLGVLVPRVPFQEGILFIGARLNFPPVALEHVLPGVDEVASSFHGRPVERVGRDHRILPDRAPWQDMDSMSRIRPPRRDEFEALRWIERDAGRAFAAIGMAQIADDEPPSPAVLEAVLAHGRAWVGVDERDLPIAYLLSSVVDGGAHIDQVSVTSAHARRGLGASLIEHLAVTAQTEGRPALTLTTFRDVPWNAPYFRRLGFEIVDPAGQGRELAALVSRESATIPSDAPRVAMRRPVRR